MRRRTLPGLFFRTLIDRETKCNLAPALSRLPQAKCARSRRLFRLARCGYSIISSRYRDRLRPSDKTCAAAFLPSRDRHSVAQSFVDVTTPVIASLMCPAKPQTAGARHLLGRRLLESA